MHSLELPVQASDGHGWALQARIPESPDRRLLWLPALGVAARHYLPFAEALAQRGIAVFVHEWRGNGSSSLRASRHADWGYRELLTIDLPASEAAMVAALPGALPVVGGHSLGGQLAACHVALAPDSAHALWLVASGSPYWRAFPPPRRYWLPFVFRFLPWLARVHGVLPGRRIGFGGDEARSLIRDWARTALSGRYAASGLREDLESRLAAIDVPVRAVLLRGDWMAPPGSLHFLLSKLPKSSAAVSVLDADALGTTSDHFAWMKMPGAVVECLVAESARQDRQIGATAAG